MTSSEGAVPVKVTVSPERSKLKSGMSMAALNSAPSPEKSGALTPALMLSLSIRLTPGPSAAFSASSSDVLADRSGSSPDTVKSLPLRMIDSGAKLSDGTDRLTCRSANRAFSCAASSPSCG